MSQSITRRELLGLLGTVPVAASPSRPTSPVAIGRCRSYREDVAGVLATMFDQLGGLSRLVRGKTVTIKLNMTGDPGLRVRGLPPGRTHYTHPKVIAAAVHLVGAAGARRIRLVESAWWTGGPLEEFMLNAGWDPRLFERAAPHVEFENTNALGKGKHYVLFKVPGKPWIFPAYLLNHAYHDTDVFVSLAKLKEHATCGVTLSLKNCFGNLPASIYGDDAGARHPNEHPRSGRGQVCHLGARPPARCAPGEVNPDSEHGGGYRVPRIIAELTAARPIDLAIIDGIESVAGGEGPWVRNLQPVKPGILLAGFNPVATDTVATAAMGYDPRAHRGQAPFTRGDNTFLLAESRGLGTTDLRNIEIRGLPLAKATFRFAAARASAGAPPA